MKQLLKDILKDSLRGYSLSTHQVAMVQSDWLRIFGRSGCYYPDVTENDMLTDLFEHYSKRS